jgi:hypothetical protein
VKGLDSFERVLVHKLVSQVHPRLPVLARRRSHILSKRIECVALEGRLHKGGLEISFAEYL